MESDILTRHQLSSSEAREKRGEGERTEKKREKERERERKKGEKKKGGKEKKKKKKKKRWGEGKEEKKCALTGNRTRASRVAGENSTTEPSVLHGKPLNKNPI